MKGLNLKNLYEYWLPKLTAPLIGDVKRSGGVLINLASLDVWGSDDPLYFASSSRNSGRNNPVRVGGISV
ncbi:MAG: hypothetical protein ACLTSL_14525 [Odoribacter splanchnicus]